VTGPPPRGWSSALIGAAALHAGFQLTVTRVVYPALADLPAQSWPAAHTAHSRRIGPVVAVVYPLLALALAGRLLARPDPAALAAATASALTVGLTAAGAAPLHGRLGRGHDPALVQRLLRVDAARSVAAVAALVAAVAAGRG